VRAGERGNFSLTAQRGGTPKEMKYLRRGDQGATNSSKKVRRRQEGAARVRWRTWGQEGLELTLAETIQKAPGTPRERPIFGSNDIYLLGGNRGKAPNLQGRFRQTELTSKKRVPSPRRVGLCCYQTNRRECSLMRRLTPESGELQNESSSGNQRRAKVSRLS